MDNPLEQLPSTDPITQIHELARDLAYGVVNGFWKMRIQILTAEDNSSWSTLFTRDETRALQLGNSKNPLA
ncbi:MAG TPA: hypothetical protein VHL11_01230, partial [Phototrophicaceae bacterium]|nr:hypothetical protein [Phototrophicaceae bacterium]